MRTDHSFVELMVKFLDVGFQVAHLSHDFLHPATVSVTKSNCSVMRNVQSVDLIFDSRSNSWNGRPQTMFVNTSDLLDRIIMSQQDRRRS